MPIMKPAKMAVTTYLRYLFTRTERALIDEILRKREQGYVDYAETAALKRIQDDLQHMVDESWVYVPQMIERRFYGHPGASEGYANASHIAGSTNMAMMETLTDNLLGEITEAAGKALSTARTLYTIARMDDDTLRKAALSSTAYAEALGRGAYYSSKLIEAAIRNHGVTAFVDKAGRNWSLSDYCNMAARTTARQAEVAGVLTKDEHDLYQIAQHASSCPVCAPLQGRVYSKSGTDPSYPPLAKAFGKIDPGGPDDLSNTYLNIHPNCLCTLLPFTEAGKSEKELEKLREFSSFETNPATNDPRSKSQIEAYREKERNRARLLRERRKKEIAKAEKASKATAKSNIEFELKNKDDKYRDSRDLIVKLEGQYKTRLQKVTLGAEKAAGSVDMSGATMRLSSASPGVALHEFAHTMANSTADKYGLTHDEEFWNEIRTVKRRYRRDVGDDVTRWISSYEHGTNNLDEFFAEAFTHAKARELDLPLSHKYGGDYEYSQQVLDIVDKYFKR